MQAKSSPVDVYHVTESPHETQVGWLSRERTLALALIVVTALAFYLCYRLVHPLLPALGWALALAVVTYPLYEWMVSRVQKANLAAGLAVVLVALTIVAPSTFVMQRVIREVASGVERIHSEAASGRWRAIIQRNPQLAPTLRWVETHTNVRDGVQQVAKAVTSRLPTFLTGSVWAVAELLITLFILFYFFRDRRAALQALRSLVPLSEAETNKVFMRVADTIHATIYGSLAVALVQGTLGGLMFWMLGLPNPLVWGAVMVLFAVVPVLGTFVVWVPAALFLALEGNWGKALILTVWGSTVVASIDNLLYPALVGQRMRLHTLPVFIAILGGLTLFGAVGLILGPITLAVTVALIDIWRRRTAGGHTAEEGVTA